MSLHLKSTGIDFADFGHGSGSMSSELMDDYEEGSWTPSMKGGTTDGSSSSQAGTGRYTKVGNLCHIQLEMSNKTLSGESGNLKFSGLPFTAGSSGGVEAHAAGMMHNFAWSSDTLPALYVAVSDTYLGGIQAVNGSPWSTWAVTNTSALYFRMGIVYGTS